MTGEREIQPNTHDLVKVRVVPAGHDFPLDFSSQIEEYAGNSCRIAWPRFPDPGPQINAGEVLLITFLQDAAIYGIEARVLRNAAPVDDGIWIRFAGTAQKIQRRAFVRVAAELAIELASPADPHPIRANTLNISANGFAVRSPAPLVPGSVYQVRILLPPRRMPLTLKAKLMRMTRVQRPGEQLCYEAGFAFEQLSEQIQRQIRSFVIRRQQESRHFEWVVASNA